MKKMFHILQNAGIPGLFDVLSSKPVLNKVTVFNVRVIIILIIILSDFLYFVSTAEW